MFKNTVMRLVRKVALDGHNNQKPSAIALVGLWRSALILCGLTGLGMMSLSVLVYLGLHPGIQQGSVFNLLYYPLMGVGTIAFGLLLILVPVLVKSVLIDLGNWGKKEA
ncbi:hypothetical protein [Cedecea sp.]|jgi:hypothetical protein|uniref:hypothetical protein n=1 Tax=Cedecea sp. TaxID=1970739 RepID=UPI002F41629D